MYLGHKMKSDASFCVYSILRYRDSRDWIHNIAMMFTGSQETLEGALSPSLNVFSVRAFIRAALHFASLAEPHCT